MAEPVRIANCSGFYGDRLAAAREMVEGGPIDVLTGDWLAELTMLILSRTRARHPRGGYARTFLTQLEQVMGTCLDRGIKVVSNAGGLDPDGCAEGVAALAERLGLAPRIAYVDGDDLMGRVAELTERGALVGFTDDGTPAGTPVGRLPDPSLLVTANAYLGCWGIVEALAGGADIVVCGRVTDAAVTCGPAAWHHGWGRTDWDALAGAVVAGHVIECGAQATGGNYSFFTELFPGLGGGAPGDRAEGTAKALPAGARVRLGFPWAEIAADGSAVIGKHEGTGGEVSVGTVTSQLLYEIGGHDYLGPDVTAWFDTINLTSVAPDRVRISGVCGGPPPSTLKVAMNEIGGFRNTLGIALTGLDIEAKAVFAEAAFWDACPFGPGDYASVVTRLDRTDKPDPTSNDEATAQWWITVKDPDERKVGRAFSAAAIETALSSIPGMYGLSGGPSGATPYGVYRPALVPAAEVPQYVHHLTPEGVGATVTVSSVAPDAGRVGPGGVSRGAPGGVSRGAPGGVSRGAPGGVSRSVPLGLVVGARSGDKGGDANLGVFVSTDEQWTWLEGFLTVERLRELLPEIAPLQVERHVFANLRACNFVIRGLLEEGVSACSRRDAQAKSLGEWLRARVVEIPEVLLT